MGGAEITSSEDGQVGTIDATGGFTSGDRPISTPFESDFSVTVDFRKSGPGLAQAGLTITGDTGFIWQIAMLDDSVYFATTGGNPAFAEFYFDAAVTIIELFKSKLEAPGRGNPPLHEPGSCPDLVGH